jgi:hypothetical protein
MSVGFFINECLPNCFIFVISEPDDLTMSEFIYYWITILGIECATTIAWYLYKLDKSYRDLQDVSNFKNNLAIVKKSFDDNYKAMNESHSGISLFELLESEESKRDIIPYIEHIDVDKLEKHRKELCLINCNEESSIYLEVSKLSDMLQKLKNEDNNIEKSNYKDLKTKMENCIKNIEKYLKNSY